MKSSYGLHWFRRDLRLTGNPALSAHLKTHPGRVLGVFCLDEDFISRPDIAQSRFLLYLNTIADLQEQLRAQGSDLIVVSGVPAEALPKLLKELEKTPLGRPASLSFNRDYEPYARDRDQRMIEILSPLLEVHTERDHLLIEPHELLKDDGTPYKVYSPFRNRWISLLHGKVTPAEKYPVISTRIEDAARGLRAGPPKFSMRASDSLVKRGEQILTRAREQVSRNVTHPLPKVGHAVAMASLKEFAAKSLEAYPTGRDIPSIRGTSLMSIYLKNGAITVPQIIAKLRLEAPKLTEGARKYLEELIWREFYYHLLFHCPEVETTAYQEKYRELGWENDRTRFQAWCEGRTGFPIVDAGMRQLNQTGWMHNRVRMITASFLTKDLLIDYRWGERYFMQKLLDGDLAPNNGGWQWASSTGTDAQPYFRVFNPSSQGERFDPDAKYLERWAPEYLGRKKPHDPLKPIVDHAQQRLKAIALFKNARSRKS